MSGSGYTYTASSRVPVRPLSYESKALALPKELLMDYTNAKIYICDINGEIIDITTKMLNQTNEMIKENLKSEETEETVRNIDIDLEDGTIVTIESGIVSLFTQLAQTNNNFNSFRQSITEYIEKQVIPTIPTSSKTTPLASTETGSVGSNTMIYALSDHRHPKGPSTIADSAKSVEWENVENKPNLSASDHNHDSVYYKISGGDITGEVGLNNNKGLYGYTTAKAKAYIGFIDTSNRVHIGYNKTHPILLDGKLLLTSDNYGESDPPTSGAVTGQIYLQLI